MKTHLLSGFATLALITGTDAAAQSLATPPSGEATPPAEAGAEANEIVVTGARLQAMKEIEAKRSIDVISDSVGSDEIGTLPDFGLGEALSRVPGISTIENNARGEAQFVSIRGLNADYNLVQIDGVSLPANETGRRNVSLDVIPSSLASRVEVYKSNTAAFNANAIGGTVNLRTRSAFDRKGRTFINGRLDLGEWTSKRTIGKRTPSGQAELLASATFGPDRKFGIVVSGSYFRRDSASLNSASDNLKYYNPTTNAALDPVANDVSSAFVAPDRRRWLAYDNVRQRYGVFGKLEFDNHLGFRTALTLAAFDHTNADYRQSNAVFQNGDPVRGTITPTSGTVNSANARLELYHFDQKRGMRYADWRGEWSPGDKIDADLGVNYATATYHQDTFLSTYRVANTTNLGYNYSYSPGGFIYFDFKNPSFFSNAANYKQYDYGTRTDDQRENALTARANLRYNMKTNDQGLGLAIGAWTRFLDRRYDYESVNYRTNTRGANYLLSSVISPKTFSPYNGRGQQLLLADADAVRDFFEANIVGYTLNSTNASDSLASDYNLSEDVTAAYVMGRYANGPVQFTAGVRYEATDLSTGSFGLRQGAFTYAQEGQSYRNWLPSAQLQWDLSDRLRVRAAYSQTIGRPNYDDLAARSTVVVGASEDAVTITSGNPGLMPRLSKNYDLSLEYYVSRDVMFAAAGFIKSVDNEIITVRNQASEIFDGREQLVTRIRPTNAGNAIIRGVELNAVVTRMSFLPKPLDGLGFSANVTILDPTPPQITQADGITLRRLSGLFESPNVVSNIRAFYTAGPATFQGAWNHVAPNLYSVSSSDPLQDRRTDTRDTFDAQLRLTLSRHITVVAQGKNLTNARYQRMTGPDFAYLREEIDNGRAFYIGALLRY